jgi:hypothetical protein
MLGGSLIIVSYILRPTYDERRNQKEERKD